VRGTAQNGRSTEESLPVPFGRNSPPADVAPPVWLICLFGQSPESIEHQLREIETAQSLRPFAPVFFTDSDRLELFRRFDYLVEFVPTSGPGAFTDQRLRTRVRSLFRTYQPDNVVVVGTHHTLAAMVYSLAPAGSTRTKVIRQSVHDLTPEEIKNRFPNTITGRILGMVTMLHLRVHDVGIGPTIQRPIDKLRKRLRGG